MSAMHTPTPQPAQPVRPLPQQEEKQASQKPNDTLWATVRGEQFVSRAYVFLVGVPWLLLRIWNLYFLGPNQDVKRYFDAGSAWLAGHIPYRDFSCEYPPGALPLFALPRLFTSDFGTYQAFFAAQMLLVDVLVMWLLWRLSAHLSPKQTPTDKSKTVDWQAYDARRFAACMAQLSYVWLTGSLGYLAFERYDLAFAALMLAWLGLAVVPRRQLWATVCLAVSVAVKMVSVFLLPLWLGFLYAQHVHGSSGRARGDFVRVCAKHAAAFVAPLAVLIVPFWYAAGDSFGNFIAYHKDRGLQIESTLSSVLLLLHSTGIRAVGTRFAYGATEALSDSTAWLAQLCGPLMLLGCLLVAGVALRQLLREQQPQMRAAVLVRSTLAMLLVVLACNKVFSPQYMLWLAPIFACCVLLQAPRLRPALVGLLVAQALTSLILFFYYINLLRLEPMGTALLFVRNGLVLLAAGNLLQLKPPRALQPRTRQAMAWAKGLVHHPRLPAIALGLCAFWVLLANFSETTANDIWIQLRSGEDIVRSRSVPYTEVYSAVVSGRPFIAHEWLCGVLFYLSTLVLGDAGLCVMTALVALGIFAAMYATFTREVRNSIWYLPLLLYMNYLVAFRVLARPHIFTILAQALMLMAIERWRRHGGYRALWWLVPMQIVWINLHGAALFGPALMGMVTGLTFLAAVFPKLDETIERPVGRKDVVEGSVMTVLLILACFVNPYGTRIVTFSLDLLGNEYAKSRVWEWTTPFLQMNTYYYWLWIWMVALSVLWFGLIARLGKRPIFDLAYAVLATYLGVRANRFMPDFALLAFPVLARTFHAACQKGVVPSLRRQRPWLEIGLAALLLCNCVCYGYAHSVREHRPLPGWGYGGDMPYAEVDLLKALQVRGTIYNEYSDGSLIINRLWPSIRPVLDSRIDLFPLDLVNDYDTAYMNPQAFANYLKRRRVNIVMLYKNRAHPGVIQYLETNPAWRRLSDANNRVLYVTRDSIRRRNG